MLVVMVVSAGEPFVGMKVKKVRSFICPPKQGCLARLRGDGGAQGRKERGRGVRVEGEEGRKD